MIIWIETHSVIVLLITAKQINYESKIPISLEQKINKDLLTGIHLPSYRVSKYSRFQTNLQAWERGRPTSGFWKW